MRYASTARSSPCRRFPRGLVLLLALASAVLAPTSLAAQESPTVRTLLSGYGAIGYSSTIEGDLAHDFTAFTSLVPLASIGSDILVEGEIELGLHGGETLVVLEHAEVHYLGFDRVKFRAGKFHLPFGMWMHTNWTNKMPTPPLLYQDTHGEAAAGALMPIPFDVGAMGTWTIPLLDGWRTSAAAWVSQGPRPGTAGGHTHDGEEEDPETEPASDAPPLAYGSNYEDNNADKMVGLRFRAVSAGGLTVQASGYRAAWDEAGDLGISGANLSVVWAPRSGAQPMFELRGEGTFLHQEYLHHGAVESVDFGGHYLQVSRRLGDFEPVVRWSRLPRAVAGHGPLVERRRQLAFGLNYWISPSVPVKAAYHWERDRPDAFFIEWAVGF